MTTIPKNGSFKIMWPEQLELTENFECILRNPGLNSGNCNVDKKERSLKFSGAFKRDFKDWIEVDLEGVRNPASNKYRLNGFMIVTYGEVGQELDNLDDFKMVPQLECQYPCRECDKLGGINDFCTSCWPSDESNLPYLM